MKMRVAKIATIIKKELTRLDINNKKVLWSEKVIRYRNYCQNFLK